MLADEALSLAFIERAVNVDGSYERSSFYNFILKCIKTSSTGPFGSALHHFLFLQFCYSMLRAFDVDELHPKSTFLCAISESMHLMRTVWHL